MHLHTLALLGLLTAVALHAAPVDYKKDDFHYTTFKKRAGKWDNKANWSSGQVPTSEEEAVIGDDSKVDLTSKVSSVSAIMLAGTGTASLTLGKDAVLETVRQLRIGRTQTNAVGILSLEGGTLRTDIKGEKPYVHLLHVGGGSTHSSTGLAYFKSGTYEGAIRIGSELANTGVGTLSIIGSQATARAKAEGEHIWITPYGTLDFILDADGVSSLDYKKANLNLAQGSRIRVVGDKYNGPSKTIVLIACKQVHDKGANIELLKFDPKYKVKTFTDRRGLVLIIQSAK